MIVNSPNFGQMNIQATQSNSPYNSFVNTKTKPYPSDKVSISTKKQDKKDI